MSKYDIQISQMGDRSVLIQWPQIIDEAILTDLISFKNKVVQKHSSLLLNHTPAYASLLLQYRNDVNFEDLKSRLEKLYNSNDMQMTSSPKAWHIPVCYDPLFAVDSHLYEEMGISHEEVIRLHTDMIYRVYMIGFLPGFLYLGGLDDRLHLPRKTTPNLRTPKGAVAIGGMQTGIYPIESPGGWNIIGRTPLSFFDITSKIPTPISQGDSIQFYEIDMQTYEVLLHD